MKYLCRNLDMVLAQEDNGRYCILFRCTRVGNDYEYEDKQGFENPMVAIAGYFGAAEMMMRRRIAQDLQKRGLDPVTGKAVALDG